MTRKQGNSERVGCQTPGRGSGVVRNDTQRESNDDNTQRESGAHSSPPLVLPPPSNPMAVARVLVEHCCLHNGAAGELTLRYWQGGWWAWRTTHWVEAEDASSARVVVCVHRKRILLMLVRA